VARDRSGEFARISILRASGEMIGKVFFDGSQGELVDLSAFMRTWPHIAEIDE
jgi:hypothetical protein